MEATLNNREENRKLAEFRRSKVSNNLQDGNLDISNLRQEKHQARKEAENQDTKESGFEMMKFGAKWYEEGKKQENTKMGKLKKHAGKAIHQAAWHKHNMETGQNDGDTSLALNISLKRLLQVSWLSIPGIFPAIFAIPWINIHVFMWLVGFRQWFCWLGEEWTLFGKTRLRSVKFFCEFMALLALDFIYLCVFLGFVTILYYMIQPYLIIWEVFKSYFNF